MKDTTSQYLPLYGHHQPLPSPPKLTHPLTSIEVEHYYHRHLSCLNHKLLLEVLPSHWEQLNLPPKELLIESEEIIRPPLAIFGHHNQVRCAKPQDVPLQNSITKTKVFYHLSNKDWEPKVSLVRRWPVQLLLKSCMDYQIPLEAALRFLIWETRRRGSCPFSISNLERELSEYVDMDEWLLRLTS